MNKIKNEKLKMKNFLKIFIIIMLFFAGCTQNQIPLQKANPKTDIKLLKKYGVTENSLIFYKDYYYFSKTQPNGISINKLDKNYNLITKKIINLLIDPKKYLIKNNHFYILGYDNIKEMPVILTFSLKTFKLISTVYIGKKYAAPADFFIDKNDVYTAINVYNNKTQSDIYIYKNALLYSKIASVKKENAKFIIPFNKGMLVLGSITYTNDDILIVYISNKKIVWARRIDLGMDDYPTSIYIKNNNIILNATSTDEMGAEVDYTFEIDKNGNILKSRKNLEFKELPVKFRT
ncbi:hypothetical protein [Lebetimonas sp. JS138]|uniref:hypothetical protein n=2 Tax=Lebetimonas TaxID=267989 RepID=UPI0004645242|nr:hypothetical protein [Lebetimonas sp. JS138]